MTHRYALTARTVALALLATPTLAETTDPHETFHAWRDYCLGVDRSKNEAVAQYCAGFRLAVSLRPHRQVSGLGAAMSLALAFGDVQTAPAANETTEPASASPLRADSTAAPLPDHAAAETVVPQNRPLPGLEGELFKGAPRGGR